MHFPLVLVLGLTNRAAMFPLGSAPAKSPLIATEFSVGPDQSLVEIAFCSSQVALEVALGLAQGRPHPGVGQGSTPARVGDSDSTMIRSNDHACFDWLQAHRGVNQNGLPNGRGNLRSDDKGNTLGGNDNSVHGSLR